MFVLFCKLKNGFVHSFLLTARNLFLEQNLQHRVVRRRQGLQCWCVCHKEKEGEFVNHTKNEVHYFVILYKRIGLSWLVKPLFPYWLLTYRASQPYPAKTAHKRHSNDTYKFLLRTPFLALLCGTRINIVILAFSELLDAANFVPKKEFGSFQIHFWFQKNTTKLKWKHSKSENWKTLWGRKFIVNYQSILEFCFEHKNFELPCSGWGFFSWCLCFQLHGVAKKCVACASSQRTSRCLSFLCLFIQRNAFMCW